MRKFRSGPEVMLFPTPAVLVGVLIDGRPNFMTAAWCGVASSKPPALSVALRSERHTLKGIGDHGEFSINVPPANLVKEVDFCGIYSGRKEDKSGIFKWSAGDLAHTPLVDECPVSMECRVLHTLNLGTHILIVGEIVQTHIAEACLTDGKPDALKIDPLIFAVGNSRYHRLGEVVGKAFSIGKKTGDPA